MPHHLEAMLSLQCRILVVNHINAACSLSYILTLLVTSPIKLQHIEHKLVHLIWGGTRGGSSTTDQESIVQHVNNVVWHTKTSPQCLLVNERINFLRWDYL